MSPQFRSAMTPEEAYDEDVRRCPTYHDGTPRRPWSQIGALARWTWERNPTPREYSTRGMGRGTLS